MKKSIIPLTLILTFGFNLTSNAQSPRSMLGIGLMVGGARLSGDVEKNNIDLAGGLMVRLTPLSFFAFKAQTSYSQMITGLNAIRTNVLNVTFSGNLFLLPSKKFSPFLSLGYSNFHFVAKDGDNNQLLRPNGSPISGWQQALQTGFGFEFFVDDAWAINTSIDYFFSHSDELDAIKQGKNDGFFNGLIGLIHYFKEHSRFENSESFSRTQRALLENAKVEEITSNNEEESLEQESISPVETTSTVILEDEDNLAAEKENPNPLSIQDSQINIPKEQNSLNENIDEAKPSSFNSWQNDDPVANGISFEPGTAEILETSVPQPKQIHSRGRSGDFKSKYQYALSQYNLGNYQGALSVLSELLFSNTKNSLSDNCQFWIGECYYGLGNYNQAIVEFEKVFSFPASNKGDDAQLKLGICYIKVGDRQQAQAELERLLSNYPDSEYIELAYRYLAR